MSIVPVLNTTEIMNDINDINTRNVFRGFTGIVDFTEVDDYDEAEEEALEEDEAPEEEAVVSGGEVVNDGVLEDYNLKSLDNVKDDYLHSMFTHENYHDFNISTIENVFSEQPLYLRRVLMLHFIIMYHSYSHLEYYLELLYRNHGIIGVNLIVNFPIENNIRDSIECYSNQQTIDSIPENKRENIFNALIVASLWSKNRNVIRLLYSYGANTYSRDLYGYYADELTGNTFYFDHLINYNILRDTMQNLYFAKRYVEEFHEVNEEIRLLAGEMSPLETTNRLWQPPNIIV